MKTFASKVLSNIDLPPALPAEEVIEPVTIEAPAIDDKYVALLSTYANRIIEAQDLATFNALLLEIASANNLNVESDLVPLAMHANYIRSQEGLPAI